MASAQRGHEADYRQLLQEVSGVIHRFLCSRFGNHPFVEDCVQEALIAIHQARHTYDPERAFRPWLFAIVRHKAIDMFRRRQTRQTTHEQYKADMEVRSQGEDPSLVLEHAIEGSILDLLQGHHREVLVLTKVLGFSIAETAGKLGISQSAVKVRVHRAIRKLHKLLEEEEESAVHAEKR